MISFYIELRTQAKFLVFITKLVFFFLIGIYSESIFSVAHSPIRNVLFKISYLLMIFHSSENNLVLVGELHSGVY